MRTYWNTDSKSSHFLEDQSANLLEQCAYKFALFHLKFGEHGVGICAFSRSSQDESGSSCICHYLITFSHIKLLYLPCSTTFMNQPLDMGVFCSIERKFRSSLFNERILTKYTCIIMAYEIIHSNLALSSTIWQFKKFVSKCELIGTLTLKVRTF